MTKRTKQEHHIPRKSYLDYFVDTDNKNLLWVYQDRLSLLQNVESADCKNIGSFNFCKESNFYESPEYGVNSIENALAEIEGKYKIVLEEKILKREILQREDIEKISSFISTLEMRTTASKQNINSFINEVSNMFSSLEQQYNHGQISEKHTQLLKMKEENTAFSQTVALSMNINRWRFSDYLFMFVRSKDDSDQFFITSDHPVTLYDFTLMNCMYGVPPLSSTAEVVVPLTPRLALFINNIGMNGYTEIDPNFVREVNNRILLYSNKYVVSSRKLTNQFVDRCAHRQRQSFLLLSLEDRLHREWKSRHKKS